MVEVTVADAVLVLFGVIEVTVVDAVLALVGVVEVAANRGHDHHLLCADADEVQAAVALTVAAALRLVVDECVREVDPSTPHHLAVEVAAEVSAAGVVVLPGVVL